MSKQPEYAMLTMEPPPKWGEITFMPSELRRPLLARLGFWLVNHSGLRVPWGDGPGNCVRLVLKEKR